MSPEQGTWEGGIEEGWANPQFYPSVISSREPTSGTLPVGGETWRAVVGFQAPRSRGVTGGSELEPIGSLHSTVHPSLDCPHFPV